MFESADDQTSKDQTWPHVPSRFLRSPVHFNRNVPLITLSFSSFPCLHVASSEPPREIWGEDSRTASPAIGRSQRSMEWGAVCMCLCELKGNHVSDTHLGLSPALDRIRHAGQNPRWDTNASLSGSLNWNLAPTSGLWRKLDHLCILMLQNVGVLFWK